MPEFEFDPDKSLQNRERHGVDLEWAQRFWDVTHVIIPAKTDREIRFLLLAKFEDKCFAVVFTTRGERNRLISCHRADRRLERLYETQVKKQES
ncbi:MAG: hypothetical protein AUJ52_04380 [Elusimicrobia bacterium CG1_02_63_36]|nr:MAG: hypothetical protein AUJ52_04380 [Elusimicrobia bacterium CG1_02_63_36]PIP82269.1 MAG: toxin [Elusimicrobia bacterium CG22_combo_CG10-13_8_21_14_all_63_91]PJA15313.1 MAG: toxin [Elusimicrobia bacterium CG_4_10_14_0_2_um_filter_63_34]PJB27002.1 MAG: toxin [Elusimicrobia bacterium CG_4_9_14_3_um_filter_62_55]